MKLSKIFLVCFVLAKLGLSSFKEQGYASYYENATKQLIVAIQNKDSKTIVDVTGHSQGEIKRIEASYPKELWEKKISEYYESVNALLFGKWNANTMPYYDVAIGSTFKELTKFFSMQSEWKILESRENGEVFVSVKYPNINGAPRLGTRFLKEVIIRFKWAFPGIFNGFQRMEEVFWQPQDKGKELSEESVAQEKSSSIELANLKTKWLIKSYDPSTPKIIIVPAAQFRIKNNSQNPINSITIKAIFRFKGESELLGDCFIKIEINLKGGETSQRLFLLKSNFGVQGKTKESILNSPNWKRAEVELLVEENGTFLPLGLGWYPVGHYIED